MFSLFLFLIPIQGHTETQHTTQHQTKQTKATENINLFSSNCFRINKLYLRLKRKRQRFPVSSAQFIGEFWKKRLTDISGVYSPIVLALHRIHSQYYWRWIAACSYRWSGAHSLPLEAKQGAFAAPISIFSRIFFIHRALPISVV
jgi:hypothetical protein